MEAKYLNVRDMTFIVITQENSVTTIPCDPANTDYQNIMKLVDEGQLVIAPAD